LHTTPAIGGEKDSVAGIDTPQLAPAPLTVAQSVLQARLKHFRAALCAVAAPGSVAVYGGLRDIDELAAVGTIRVQLMDQVGKGVR
jgi:hypothetical protein